MSERLAAARAALAAAEAAAAATSAPPPPASQCTPRSTTHDVDIDDTVDDEAVARARSVATRTLAHHARTRHQLASKLAARGFEDEVVELTLQWCVRHGLIDDDAYAADFVRQAHQTRGLGRAALRHTLLNRGVDVDTVEQHVAGIDSLSERAAAEALVRRRLPSLVGVTRAVATRRLAAQLGRRGYDPELAYSVIRQEIDQHPAFSRD